MGRPPAVEETASYRLKQMFLIELRLASRCDIKSQPKCPLWVTCGRRLGKNFLTSCSIVGCGQVSGLLMRRLCRWP